MLKIKIENSFKKDIEKAKKSGLYSKEDFEILKEVISTLQKKENLNIKYKRHPLKGELKDL